MALMFIKKKWSNTSSGIVFLSAVHPEYCNAEISPMLQIHGMFTGAGDDSEESIRHY